MSDEFAVPSGALKQLWREWIKLHSSLEERYKGVAAPFLSAASKKKRQRRILVVGKATAGDWWLGSYRKSLVRSTDEAIRDRLSRNRELVRSEGNHGAFWRFFCALVDRDSDPEFDGVIWSNFAKIGTKSGNPGKSLLSAQSDLAERTLRREITEYKPALVVIVTGTYAGEFINHALERTNRDWKKSGKDRDTWWTKGKPSFLWTRHPQGAGKQEADFWIDKARNLMGE
jgi:hypothetical protein